MKKSLLFFIACAFMAVNSYSQWNLTGNSNATNTSLLGTTNSISLRLATKNTPRLVIDTLGRIGIGTSSPVNILTVKGAGSTPAASWANTGAPLFVGFGETTVGNADFILGMGSAASNARPVFIGRKSRGTLAAPAAVNNNDFLMSFLASGYDGSSFQNPAAIDFYVDGTASAGNVPGRISFVTGTNSTNRSERLIIKSNGNVGIGTALPTNKFEVSGGNALINGNLYVTKNTNLKGAVGINGDTLSGTALYVNANATTNGIRVKDPLDNYVLYSEKSGENNGVYISSSTTTSGSGAIAGVGTGTAIGVEAYGSLNNGLYAQSDSAAAVYGVSNTSIGVYGESGDPASYAGYFNGDVFSSGTFTSSDARLKNNIKDFGNAMQIIDALQPRSYDFKQEGQFASLNLPRGNHYGLIAQDLEIVLPNLVKETNLYVKDKTLQPGKNNAFSKGKLVSFKAVNYTELIPIMLKGMQEISKKNDELGMMNGELKTKAANQQEVNEDLQLQINELKALIKGTITSATEKNSQSVTLNSGEVALAQNVPNPPVNNATRIGYNIPNGTTKAELIITDIYGKKIKQIALNNTGKGLLNVDTNGLAAGTYSYTLLVDGKVIETKKMIITRN